MLILPLYLKVQILPPPPPPQTWGDRCLLNGYAAASGRISQRADASDGCSASYWNKPASSQPSPQTATPALPVCSQAEHWPHTVRRLAQQTAAVRCHILEERTVSAGAATVRRNRASTLIKMLVTP